MIRKQILAAAIPFLFIASAGADGPRILGRAIKIAPSFETQRLELNWPLLAGLDNHGAMERVNGDLFDFFLGGEGAPVVHIPPPADGDFVLRYELKMDYDVPLLQNGLLCVKKTVYEYTGGAHGMTVWDHRLYDLESGSRVELGDLLAEGFEEKLEDLINRHVDRSDMFDPAARAKLDDASSWFASPEAFVVHYPLYSLKPYAYGAVDVAIPWSEMRPLLRLDGPAAKLPR